MKNKKVINSKLRWFINILTMVVMLITIIFGSIFYLKPNLNTNSSSISGISSTLRIRETNNTNLTNTTLPSAREVLNTTKKYLQSGNSASAYDLNLSSNNLISLKSYKDRSDKEKADLIRSLVTKPYLTITDSEGRPVFYRGQFTSILTPGERKTLQDFMDGDPADFMPSLEANPASATNKQGTTGRVNLKMTKYGWDQFIRYANENVLLGIYNRIYGALAGNAYIWVNLKEFINIAQTQFPEDWEKAKRNPVNFAYIGNDANPRTEGGNTKDSKDNNSDNKNNNNNKNRKTYPPVLKTHQINAAKYLLAVANPVSLRAGTAVETTMFIPNNNKDGYTDDQLANMINYAMAPFSLEEESTHFMTTSSTATNRYLIVLAILYSLFAVFLISRFRLFGLLAAICLAFFVFVTFVIVVALEIFISVIVALTIIVALILAFMLIFNQLNIFKNELKRGSNVAKSAMRSLKSSLLGSFDSTVSLIILLIFGIFISTSYSTIAGIIIFIAIVSGFLIANVLQMLLLRNFARSESFDHSSKAVFWDINIKPNSQTKTFNSINKYKIFFILFAILVVVALVVFASLAVLGKQVTAGLNLTNELKPAYRYVLKPQTDTFWSLSEAEEIVNSLKSISGITSAEAILENQAKSSYQVIAKSQTDLTSAINNLNHQLITAGYVSTSQIIPVNLAADFGLIIGIIFGAIAVISIYMAFKYSLAAATILWVKQIIMMVGLAAFMLMTYSPISTNLIDTLLIATIFVIQDSIIHSSRVKDEFKKDLNTKNFIYDNDKINEIFKNISIEIVPNQIALLLIGLVSTPLLALLMQELSRTIVFGITFAIIILVITNLFLVTDIWRKMTMLKFKLKTKRIESNYWNTQKVEEQTFVGINDYSK
ncbi:bifunctional preprotein translocase subunit SecD/SecF [Metamycoplasma arthritidis]|uniref:Protein-export membrane protein SecD n=1 Tax=Metamycoplasma arthritidis (strain 158L3-1) TaxID=243272 RepID=B3PMK5_META1|nr:hypothetical protein [Metamycoplasma arthritidis]ACF07257.1 protein-export membrane protein SecD [Metamycoplasma arthritidis 158L3-1]VEU78780.1 bifunctional preprotein translocase subunit SecD/SecF [Metamycoplasma arthritidis]